MELPTCGVLLPMLLLVLRLVVLFFAAVGLDGFAAGQGSRSAKTETPPNVVFILADDLGYGETGCYGQEKIQTPHIDALARQGLRFTRHYSGAPVCAPARCVLMTGQNLAHAEIRGNRDSGNGREFPGQWPVTDEIVTIAEVLQRAGYRTGGFGKWGLGPTDSSGSPMRQGFDRFYGYNCQRNAHSYFPPFLDDDAGIDTLNTHPVPGHKKVPEGEILAEDFRAGVYAPDRILEEALKFLDSAAQPTQGQAQPFFLYLPFVEPHVAMQPPQEWIDRYPVEWDQENGVYRGQNGYLPHPRPRAAYAAMISDLDQHVGAIVGRLEQLGQLENTLIVFTSDNGPTHGGSDPKFSVGGAACTFFDSTGGLRGYKGSCYEGGLRVPCVVRWPGKVPEDRTTDFPSYFADWFPTLCAVCGAELPGEQILDGIDLMPVLTGSAAPVRSSPMIWDFNEYGGIIAINDGRWKAVRRNVLKEKPGDWELYDLSADEREENNLARQHPEEITRLEQIFIATRSVEPDFPLPLYDRPVKLAPDE